MRSTYSK